MHVVRGVLITTDKATVEYLRFIDEFGGNRFIIKPLDATRLFVSEEALPIIKSAIDDRTRDNTYQRSKDT